MKRIIICTDGTWNKRGQKGDGGVVETNVQKIHDSIEDRDGNIRQLKYYDSGVGTGWLLDKIIGGTTGRGLDKKIKKAYKFIVENYEPGDELYLFGFSRGAYTVRSLVGMIRNIGILRDVHAIDDAFSIYRSRDEGTDPNSDKALKFRTQLSYSYFPEPERQGVNENGELGLVTTPNRTTEQLESMKRDHVIPIKFVGIWDTVGALGIPSRYLLSFRQKKYKFHDITLTSTVDHAYHAIAVDEQRKTFIPSIWEKSANNRYGTNKYVQQMWFPGVHSNVGGGYPDTCLSDVALEWIINKAKIVGLRFRDHYVNHATWHGLLYDSRRSLLFRYSKPVLRPITLHDGVDIELARITMNPDLRYSYHEYVHVTVRERMQCPACNYFPLNAVMAERYQHRYANRLYVN